MISSYQAAEEKLQKKIQSLITQQKALEKKQADFLLKKCKAFMKEDFDIGIILNILEEAWTTKTPEQLAGWRRQAEPRNSKTHQSKPDDSKASQKVQNENKKGTHNDTVS